MRVSDEAVQDYINDDGAYADDVVLMDTVQDLALDLRDARATLRDAVAAALFFDDEEHDEIEVAVTAWRWLKGTIETDPMWSEGKHRGDCTRQVFTCHRCLVERYERLADRIIEAIHQT